MSDGVTKSEKAQQLGALFEDAWADISSSLSVSNDRMSYSVAFLEHQAVAGATSVLARISGTAGGQAFSVIAKGLTSAGPTSSIRWYTTPDEHDPFYWKRECVVYRDKLFGSPGRGLRAARLYAAREDSTSAVVFIEDVVGVNGMEWGYDDYLDAAVKLARYQAFATHTLYEGDATTVAGFNAFFLEYLRRREPLFSRFAETLGRSTPFSTVNSLKRLAPIVKRLWDDRARICTMLAGVPATQCHFDFWSANIFKQAGPLDDLVAIDLAYVGPGNLGHDLANMIVDGIIDFCIPSSDSESIWQGANDRYVEGIRRHIVVDELHLRRTMELTAALKFTWLFPATLEAAQDDRKLEAVAQKYGSVDDFFARRCRALEFVGTLIRRSLYGGNCSGQSPC